MSEMVQRAMFAFIEALTSKDAPEAKLGEFFILGNDKRRMALEPAMRAAIEAMREPSDAMLKASAETPGMKRVDAVVMTAFARSGVDMLKDVSEDGAPILQSWRAMIDEALR